MADKHCCDVMRRQLDWHCDIHEEPYDCADALLMFNPKFQEYMILIHDGGTSGLVIQFCPWCGIRLPESQRDRYYDELEKRGHG